MKDRKEARRELCASGEGETGARARAQHPAALASNPGMNTKFLHAPELGWIWTVDCTNQGSSPAGAVSITPCMSACTSWCTAPLVETIPACLKPANTRQRNQNNFVAGLAL